MRYVIKAFVDHGRLYGYQLMTITGLSSGSLYPLLARLEARGWLSGGREEGDPAVLKRPLRRYMDLNPAFLPQAHDIARNLPGK